MRILITGAAGFIGGRLAAVAARAGHDVLGIDGRTPSEPPQKWQFQFGDLRNRNRVSKILGIHRPTLIYHFAAISHVPTCAADPEVAFDVNVGGTVNLLAAAVRLRDILDSDDAKQFRIILAGSGEEYGFGEPDEYAPLQPKSLYAATKAAVSVAADGFRATHGINVQIARMANIYGPGQGLPFFIPLCAEKLLNGEPIDLHGNGMTWRDWLYIEDACAAFMAVGEQQALREPVWNFGGAEQARILTVAEIIRNLTDTQKDLIRQVPGQIPPPVRMQCTKTWDLLMLRPKVKLFDGLKETVSDIVKRRRKEAA